MAAALEGRYSTVLKVRMLSSKLGLGIETASYHSLPGEKKSNVSKLGEPHGS